MSSLVCLALLSPTIADPVTIDPTVVVHLDVHNPTTRECSQHPATSPQPVIPTSFVRSARLAAHSSIVFVSSARLAAHNPISLVSSARLAAHSPISLVSSVRLAVHRPFRFVSSTGLAALDPFSLFSSARLAARSHAVICNHRQEQPSAHSQQPTAHSPDHSPITPTRYFTDQDRPTTRPRPTARPTKTDRPTDQDRSSFDQDPPHRHPRPLPHRPSIIVQVQART